MNVARKKTLLSVPIHLQSFFTVETPLFVLTNYGFKDELSWEQRTNEI